MTPPALVLVVEDDPDIAQVVTMLLSLEGYDVQSAPNGAEGLEAVKQRPPDVILLDMFMPVCDGWQFAELYRQLPQPHAPIIVMTAAADARQRAAAIGADAFIGKPFDVNELVALVGRFAPS